MKNKVTVVDKQQIVKLVKNNKVTVKQICDILFSEIMSYQDSVIKDKITHFRYELEAYPYRFTEMSTDAVTDTLLKEVTKEVVKYIDILTKEHANNILDAKNENLITTSQMKKLLTVLNSLNEAVEIELKNA